MFRSDLAALHCSEQLGHGKQSVAASAMSSTSACEGRDFTRDLAFEVTDPTPPAGACHAYWLRVTQEDGAQAWTSPVYLTRT
jgi:hypothetical protein